jgi:putative tricarboxylic transport membrane protein
MTIETSEETRKPPQPQWQRTLSRPDVMSGLMFITIAVIGLAVSWNYSIGTAVRMGTGYVPRLMLWVLLGLGALVLFIGLRGEDEETGDPPLQWRPLVLIPLAMTVFALAMDGIRLTIMGNPIAFDGLGFIISGTLLLLIGGLAYRGAKPLEVILSTIVLVFFSWAIFVWALGLTIPVWPGN